MHLMTENKVEPKLRFKDFDNKYEVKKIGDLAKINPQTSVPDNFKYIDLGSVKNGVLLSYKSLNVKEAPSRAQRLLEENDIIFQAVRPYQQNNYLFNLDGKYVASTGYLQIRGAEVASFLYQYFLTNKFLIQVLRFSEGSSYPAISSNAFKIISLNIPSSLEEQQKIASFLTSVDNKITLLTKKKELLEQYKKGVTQKIFSQEIRFQDDSGNSFPDWVTTNLFETFKFIRGKQIKEEKDTGYYILNMGSVLENGKLNIKEKEGIGEILLKNDLVMPERDIGVGKIIGRVALVKSNSKYVLGSNLICLRPLKKHISKFVFYQINSSLFRKKIHRLVNGSAQLMITSKDIKKLKILLPNLQEQNKVAEFLSSLDKKIDLVNSQIDKTKEFKKGLLQQMFV
jgi:type I restriction enzyme, S subunit